MSASFMKASAAQSRLSHLPTLSRSSMLFSISFFARPMTISRQRCFVSTSVITSVKDSVTSFCSVSERSNENLRFDEDAPSEVSRGSVAALVATLRSATACRVVQPASNLPASEIDSFPASSAASSRMSGRFRTSRQSTGVPLFVRSRSVAKLMGSLPIFSSLLERTLAPVLIASEGTVEARWLIIAVMSDRNGARSRVGLASVLLGSILRPSVRMMHVALGSRSCHRQRSSLSSM
mmetsp:Transcript_29035/g.73664  ORF Transcript_29035/g.73664 Transcript_29035/m.73664 type:complete len:236 (+) Transcript_29035:477-1184(+)